MPKKRKQREASILLLTTALSCGIWFIARAQEGNGSPSAKESQGNRSNLPDAGIPNASSTIPLPNQPPPGWDPKVWAALRESCQRIANKGTAHVPLSADERVTSQTCSSLAPLPTTLEPQILHGYKSGDTNSPHALQTPVPSESGHSGPGSAGDPPTGPFLPPIAGGYEDACVTGQSQPPDVATDISSTQFVQLLNDTGIWVFNKATGHVSPGYPISANTFWANNSPPPGNYLSDPQIAFEPISQRWIATELSVTSAKDNGDLYFAFSETADATGQWNVSKFPNICSNGQPNTPAPDMRSWATIKTG